MNNNENGFNENETENISEFEITQINEITEETLPETPIEEMPLPEELQNGKLRKKEEKGIMTEIFEWAQAIAVALVVAMFLRTYVFTLVKVSGNSMVPTLQNNERLVVWRMGYNPEIGDIIVFRPRNNPKEPYIKRVIATEGQTVDIRKTADGTCDVYVDGNLIEETYINEEILASNAGNHAYPVTVPPGHIFAMVDNRNHSLDSRFKTVDVVSEDSIVGHAVWRFWPFDRMEIFD